MFWLFRRKSAYLVTFKYASTSNLEYSELVRAYDFAHAWTITKRKHPFSIYMVSIKRINERTDV